MWRYFIFFKSYAQTVLNIRGMYSHTSHTCDDLLLTIANQSSKNNCYQSHKRITEQINILQVVSCAVLDYSHTSYIIDGLIPYTEYTVEVKACTTAGNYKCYLVSFVLCCFYCNSMYIPSSNLHLLFCGYKVTMMKPII